MAKNNTKNLRRVKKREARDRFLIVCEGEKTEPNYFCRFHASRKKDIYGIGADPINVVKKAVKLKKERMYNGYEQVWCVFDRDDFEENFNQALTLAKRNNIKVAYSIEAFEIWFLLHFDYIDTAIPREDYKKKLTEKLGKDYEKNIPDMYDLVENKQKTAIENATKLLAQYGNQHRPVNNNPSTTVHLLVQALNDTITTRHPVAL